MRKTAFRFIRPALPVLALLTLAACNPDPLVTCNGGSGRSANNCLAFRTNSAPTVDGVINADEWLNGFRYVLGDGNGTSVPHAVVQGQKTADAVYLSFEVNNDPDFNLQDVIVLAFDPTGNAANHRRIHIFPVFPAGAAGSGQPQQVQYWKDSTQANWTDPTQPPAATPAWLLNNIRVSSADSGSSKHWYAEMRIPIVAAEGGDGINFPAADDFGFYFSVIGTEVGAGEELDIAAEYSWPLNTNVGLFLENTPAASAWGNGVFGQFANGVSITTMDITTDQIPDHHIEVDVPNTFRANVRNRMVSAAGAPVAASNVFASFTLKNFGIPGVSPWSLIPAGNNPTPASNVPAGSPGSFLFQTAPWSVPPDLRDDYLANPNQCLLVEIDSKGPNTLITNRRAMRNTKFVDTKSPFQEGAVVSTAGYRLPEGQRELDFVLREFRYNTAADAPWKSALSGAKPVRDRVYRLSAPVGPDVKIDPFVTPPEIQIPMERVTVPPGRGSQVRKLEVRPGNIITLVADGSITRGDLTIGPNGTAAREAAGKEARYPLPASASPDTRVGALIGTFDGVPDSGFVVGRATTVLVPAGASSLTLAINDTEQGLPQQGGRGFNVEVIQTAADDAVRRYTRALLPQRPVRQVVELPLGQNLPTWILCGLWNTGGPLTIRGQKFMRFADAGCFSYAVKSIAAAPIAANPGAGTPGTARPGTTKPGGVKG